MGKKMKNEEVIKILKTILRTVFLGNQKFIDAVKFAISALEKQERDRWIPVTERLPKVHEAGDSFSGKYMQSDPVLVYGVEEYAAAAQFHVATYCDDLEGYTYWSTEPDALTIKGVKAWHPLPEPYTAG